jgi:hypothetical protein
MQLAYLMILEHWRVTNYIGLQMMKENMSCVNEELGEVMFSMLAKVTLGHPGISDFQHMSRMFSLLPVYRDIKLDIHEDLGRKDTMNWHHTIKTDDENVLMTGVFFRGLVRRVVNNTYKAYNGQPECYKNQESGASNSTVNFLPLVYSNGVVNSLNTQCEGITKALSSNFVRPHADLWRGHNQPDGDDDIDGMDDNGDDHDGGEGDEVDVDQQWGAPWSQCSPGKLAVARCNFPGDGLGIAVYSVVSINVDEVVGDDTWRSFTGVQLDCSIKNTTIDCLRGRWRKGLGGVVHEKVWDWEVLAYIDNLRVTEQLPDRVIRLIDSVVEEEQVFQNQ